jgi:hypothetical protein
LSADKEEDGGNDSKEGDDEDFLREKWVPFGNGKYFLSVRSIADLPREHPFSTRGSGLLVEASAQMNQNNEIGIKILLEDPPSCRLIAWWQSRGM